MHCHEAGNEMVCQPSVDVDIKATEVIDELTKTYYQVPSLAYLATISQSELTSSIEQALDAAAQTKSPQLENV